MSTLPTPRPFASRPALLAVIALLAAVLLGTAGWRASGLSARAPDAAATAVRELRFEDRADGSVAVIDHRRGTEIERVRGEAGFLRGSLRALARERQRSGFGAERPFELSARADGRLTLSDPTTGARVDLESFGPTNAAVYARLLALP